MAKTVRQHPGWLYAVGWDRFSFHVRLSSDHATGNNNLAKKTLVSLLVFAVFLSFWASPIVIASGEAMASERAHPQPSQCLRLASRIGASRVWWGRHVGTRDRETIFEIGPQKEYFKAIGCFKSRKECEDWLYWKRTEYPEFTFARPCRRGL